VDGGGVNLDDDALRWMRLGEGRLFEGSFAKLANRDGADALRFGREDGCTGVNEDGAAVGVVGATEENSHSGSGRRTSMLVMNTRTRGTTFADLAP
jgi:hypothetical protein